ncbi:MAG: CYTH domain-containing protein [Clostridia bacterium]|nr:CYTH domain-containing protein [Clostridia bacterium]
MPDLFKCSVKREMKFLFDEDSFYDMLRYTKKRYKIARSMKTEQTDFYYDTPVFSLLKNNITLRIRKTEEEYFLQIKRYQDLTYGIYTTTESESVFAHLPKILKGSELELGSSHTYEMLGKLKTNRKTMQLPDGTIIRFDISEYFDKIDYEIKMQFSDYPPEELVTRLSEHSHQSCSKYNRFIEAYENAKIRIAK